MHISTYVYMYMYIHSISSPSPKYKLLSTLMIKTPLLLRRGQGSGVVEFYPAVFESGSLFTPNFGVGVKHEGACGLGRSLGACNVQTDGHKRVGSSAWLEVP